MGLHNQPQISKVFNLNRFLLFPYCIAPLLLAIYGAIPLLYSFIFEYDPLMPIGKVIILTSIALIALIILLWINYHSPRNRDGKVKVYLMIVAEDWSYDNYICTDVYENMRSFLLQDQAGWDVIVPNIYYRYHLCQSVRRYAKKGQDFLLSKSWHRKHKTLNGSFYLIGELRLRNARGVEHFEFAQMRMVVAHRDGLRDEQRAQLISVMGKYSVGQWLLNRNYEFEHLTIMSQEYVHITEFIVGLARYMSGDIITAYQLHGKLTKQKCIFRNRQLFVDAAYYLGQELENLVQPYITAQEYQKASAMLEKHKVAFGESVATKVLDTHILIKSSNTLEEFRQNARTALELFKDFSVEDESNRAVVLLNRAYLCLALQRYSEADKYYRAAVKYATTKEYNSVIVYCNWVLNNPNKGFEYEIARFVKAYALYRLRNEQATDDLLLVIKDNDKNSYYYKTAMSMMKSYAQQQKTEDDNFVGSSQKQSA